jgi:anthranilate synthase component II
MILVIDNYDSFTWNLVHYLMELGAEVEVVRNDAISAGQAMSSGAEAFLISPGPCTPDKAGISLDLVAACADAARPLLGVCLGHQAIGQHFGGQVVRGGLMHGKTSPVSHDGTGLFQGLPSPFTATRYHSLIVADIPDSLIVNATSDTNETGGGACHGLPPHYAPDPWRPVPPRKHRDRTRPCDARQLHGARRNGHDRARMTPVAFTLTANDMVAGNRLAVRRYVRKGAVKFAIAVVIVSLAVSVFAFGMRTRPVADALLLFGKIFATYAVIAIVFTLGVLFIMPKRRATKNFRQMPALSREQAVSWDETSITFNSTYGNAIIPLAELHQWAADDRANDGIVIIYPADHLFYMLPARVFATPSDRERLIAALEASGIKRI